MRIKLIKLAKVELIYIRKIEMKSLKAHIELTIHLVFF